MSQLILQFMISKKYFNVNIFKVFLNFLERVKNFTSATSSKF